MTLLPPSICRNLISDALCETKTTYEHALQIASRQNQDTSLYTCLKIAKSAEPPQESVIFCSTEQFCGMGVEPHKTGALSNLNNVTCSIFLLEDMVVCSAMNQTLDENGKLFTPNYTYRVFGRKQNLYSHSVTVFLCLLCLAW